MALESLGIIALQSGILFLILWLVFRYVPALPANARAWIWRIAFLKPIISLIPFAAVTLYVLPSPTLPQQASVVQSQSLPVDSISSGTAITSQVVSTPSTSINPLVAIYIIGAAGVAGWGLLGSWSASRRVRRAQPVSDAFTLEAADDFYIRAQIRRKVRLVQSDEIQSAMLVGGMRPTIVLPAAAILDQATSDIRLMLAHEVAHIARRDLFWFGLTWFVQSLFFFNPVVWLAARRSRLDHESATDQYASQLAAVPTQTYAEMLLRTSVVVRNTSLVPGTLPMGESFRMIHRRLEAMKHFDTKPYRWRKSAIGAIALVTIGLLPLYQWAEASSELDSAKHGVTPPHKKQRKTASAQVPKTIQKPGKAAPVPPKASPNLDPAKAAIAPSPVPTGAAPLKTAQAGDPFIGSPESIPARAINPAVNPVGPAPIGTERAIYRPASPSAPAPASQKRAINPAANRFAPTPMPSMTVLPSPNAPEYGSKRAPIPVANPSSVPPRSDNNVKPVAAPPIVSYGAVAQDPLVSGTHQTISFKFEFQDTRAAIEALLRHEHLKFVIESSVIGQVTITVENVDFDVALEAMMKAAHASYVKEGDTYFVSGNK